MSLETPLILFKEKLLQQQTTLKPPLQPQQQKQHTKHNHRNNSNNQKNTINTQQRICLGRVSHLEDQVKQDWWKTVFADDMYLLTDGDVVEDPDITREEIRQLEKNPTVLEVFQKGSSTSIDSKAALNSFSSETTDSLSDSDKESKDDIPPSRVLDLCCGQGRHAIELAKAYPHLVINGHDQSSYLIQLAKERATSAGISSNVTFTVGDCRNVPFPDDHFQIILVMGNSFGYFDADSDDRAVLDEIHRVLAPGGHLVLDMVDGGYMRDTFVDRSWEWVDDGTFVCRERSLSRDQKRLLSREVVTKTEVGVIRDQFYQERLYSQAEITDVLEASGLLDVAKLNDGGYGAGALERYAASYGSSSSDSSNETAVSALRNKSPAEVVTIAKDLSKRKEDLGMMAQRMFIFAMKPTSVASSEAGDEIDSDTAGQIFSARSDSRERNYQGDATHRRAKISNERNLTVRVEDANNFDESDIDARKKNKRTKKTSASPRRRLLAQPSFDGPDSPLLNASALVNSTASTPTLVSTAAGSPPPFSHPFTVILGDPRQPCQGKLNDTWNPEDHETRRKLVQALSAIGYPDDCVDYLDDHRSLVSDLCFQKPAFVFNLCDEGFGNEALKELHVPALLEMMGIKYSGAGPVCLGVCYDKGLVNRTAKAIGVPIPRETYYLADNASARVLADPSSSTKRDFYDPDSSPARTAATNSDSASLTSTNDINALTTAIATEIGYPCFIKPMRGDNSIGITVRSVVRSPDQAAEYIAELRADGIRDVIVQEYLEGDEFGVGVIGNLDDAEGGGLRFLPTLKVDFTRILERDLPPILGHESKWDPTSPYWTDITFRPANLPTHQDSALRSWCAILFERFGCRDYARFDFRADKEGNIKLLEVNPNPGWCWDGKFAKMAEMEGMGYEEMLGEVLAAAYRRCFPDSDGEGDDGEEEEAVRKSFQRIGLGRRSRASTPDH